jgi:hypothetical protein
MLLDRRQRLLRPECRSRAQEWGRGVAGRRVEGQVEVVTGSITSNLFVDGQLGVIDHHFGVLLLS